MKKIYSPVLKSELLLVLIEDVRLIVLKYSGKINSFMTVGHGSANLEELENIGMMNFKNYQDLNGKLSSNTDFNNWLSVHSTEKGSIISIILADRWIAVIRTLNESLVDKIESNSDESKNNMNSYITKGENLKKIFMPTQYVSIRDFGMKQVKDIKFTYYVNKIMCVILYVNDIKITRMIFFYKI